MGVLPNVHSFPTPFALGDYKKDMALTFCLDKFMTMQHPWQPPYSIRSLQSFRIASKLLWWRRPTIPRPCTYQVVITRKIPASAPGRGPCLSLSLAPLRHHWAKSLLATKLAEAQRPEQLTVTWRADILAAWSVSTAASHWPCLRWPTSNKGQLTRCRHLCHIHLQPKRQK